MPTCSQVLRDEGKPYPRTCAVHGLSCPKPDVDDRVPIAATDGRPVDYVDVTGWGVFKGHAIPVGIARFIVEKINLYAERRETALRQRIEELEQERDQYRLDYLTEVRTAQIALEALDRVERVLRNGNLHETTRVVDAQDIIAALGRKA